MCLYVSAWLVKKEPFVSYVLHRILNEITAFEQYKETAKIQTIQKQTAEIAHHTPLPTSRCRAAYTE